MTKPAIIKPDPKLDLVLERFVDVPPELVWKAWTTPEAFAALVLPKAVDDDRLRDRSRPGGIFRSVMRSPEGKEFPNVGCYLEVVPNERLVWTDALLPGYRPSAEPFLHRRADVRAKRQRHALYRDRHPPRRGGTQEARRDGLPRRLGHGRRPVGGIHKEGDVTRGIVGIKAARRLACRRAGATTHSDCLLHQNIAKTGA